MDNIYIGKIVSTHGIKGELRILSDFEYKDKVFVVGNKLIIDNKDYIIKSYRHHKNFEMVTLNDYKDINEVLFLLKRPVYFSKEDLHLGSNEVLDSDLINYQILTTDGKSGIIKEIFLASANNKILRIQLDKEVLVPLSSPMRKEINKEKKQVIIELIEGM